MFWGCYNLEYLKTPKGFKMALGGNIYKDFKVYFSFCMLIRMTMWSPGFICQGLQCSVIFLSPSLYYRMWIKSGPPCNLCRNNASENSESAGGYLGEYVLLSVAMR